MPVQSKLELRMVSRKSPLGKWSVRPGALALEACQDGVVAQGFLGQAFALEGGVAHHEVAHDQGHLDAGDRLMKFECFLSIECVFLT